MSDTGSCRKSVSAGMIGLAAAFVPQTSIAADIAYVLSGAVQVGAAENAVDEMVVGLNAAVTAKEDGSVTGRGTIVYLQMKPCEWEPPYPDRSPSPWCRIDGVEDGTFSVTGQVLETVHRHDDDNPLKDAIFSLADKYSTERLGYAPAKIRFRLEPQALPGEQLTFWGFSDPKTEYRTTGAATLGVMSSGVFGTSFEIVPVSPGADVPGLQGGNVHVFKGAYSGGTPVVAEGHIAVIDAGWQSVPSGTNPAVYLAHWSEGPVERPFSEQEVAAIEQRNNELSGAVSDTIQQLNDLDSVYANLDVPAPPDPGRYSPINLLDDTRSQ